mgnify:CR=1 FL=1|jgi:hypothetical protein
MLGYVGYHIETLLVLAGNSIFGTRSCLFIDENTVIVVSINRHDRVPKIEFPASTRSVSM